MNPNTHSPLESLFTNFNVTELGDGDPAVGAHALAAMCCTLAATARPGSGLRAKSGRIFRMGTSILVSGSASVGRVMDEVILELNSAQNNFSLHLQRDYDWTEQKRMSPELCTPLGVPMKRVSNVPSSEFPGSADPFLGVTHDRWKRIFSTPPREGDDPHAVGRKFFVAVARPKDLEKQLTDLRPGQPLVHLAVSKTSDLAGFGETVGALLDGCLGIGRHGEMIRGQVIVTDPLNVLANAARNPTEEMAWVARLLWLRDNDAGPELPKAPEWQNLEPGESLSERFRDALKKGLAIRVGGDAKEERIINAEIELAQHRWIRYLKEMEKSLPGISGTARNLLATLTFGLHELSLGDVPKKAPKDVMGLPPRDGKPPTVTLRKDLPLSIAEIEAFAQYLVKGMANARAALLYPNVMARRQTQIKRVFRKLGAGPIKARIIYQHLNLPAEECRECLGYLETSNLAICTDAGWECVEGAELSFSDHPVLTLDV